MSQSINSSILWRIHLRARASSEKRKPPISPLKVIDVDPSTARAYQKRASAKFIEGDFSGAIEDNLRVIRIEPRNVVAHNNIGAAMLHLKDYQGAIFYFNKALELSPNCAKAYLNRGNAKDSLGNPLGAVRDYTKAIECEPQYAAAYINRAITYLRLQKPDRARADFYKAIELHFPVSADQLDRCDELEHPEETSADAPDAAFSRAPEAGIKTRLRDIFNSFGRHIHIHAGTHLRGMTWDASMQS